MYRYIYSICLLAFLASLGFAQGSETSPFVMTEGSSTIEKLIVTNSSAKIYSEPKGEGKIVAQGSIFYRLTVDGKLNEQNGMYKVGTQGGEFVGWVKKDSVVSLPSFAIAAPIGRTPLTVYKSMDSEETVTAPANSLPFVVMNSKALKNGFLEVVYIPWEFSEEEATEETPEDTVEETPEDETEETPEDETEETPEDETEETPEDETEETPVAPAEETPEPKADSDAVDFVFVIETTSSNDNLIEILNKVVQKIQKENVNVRLGLVEYRDSQSDFAFDAKFTCPFTTDMSKFARQATALKCENEDIVYVAEVFGGLKTAIDDSKWLNENQKNVILFSAAPSKDILIKEIMDEKVPTECAIKTAEQMKKYMIKKDVDLFVVHNNFSTQKSWGGKDWRARALSEAKTEIEQFCTDKSNVVNVGKEDEADDIVEKVFEFIKDKVSADSSSESTSSSTDAEDKDVSEDEVDDLFSEDDDKSAKIDSADEDESESGDEAASPAALIRGFIKIYDSDNEPLVKIQRLATRDSLEKYSDSLYSAQRTLDRISAGRGGNIRVMSNNLISGTYEFLTGDNVEDLAIDELDVSAMERLPSEFTDGIFNVIPMLKATSPKVKVWYKRINNWSKYTNDLLNSDSDEWSKLPDGTQYRIIDLPGEE